MFHKFSLPLLAAFVALAAYWGTLCLYRGGHITMQQRSIEFGAPKPSIVTTAFDRKSQKILQRATAAGETSTAISSLGSVYMRTNKSNEATSATDAETLNVSQRAEATGKHSSAVNALGDVVIK